MQVGKDNAQPALSFVGYEDELRPAMEYIFGSTFVCDTLENAKKVFEQRFKIVHPLDFEACIGLMQLWF